LPGCGVGALIFIPERQRGSFEREGYTFDVGASNDLGFAEKVTTNLLTAPWAAVGEHQEDNPLTAPSSNDTCPWPHRGGGRELKRHVNRALSALFPP